MKRILALLLSAIISISMAVVPVTTQAAVASTRITYINQTIEKSTTYVFITKTGEKYHRSGCQYLRKSCYKISLKEAKKQGYTPCSRCDPPTRR